jgi:hypothetical protein
MAWLMSSVEQVDPVEAGILGELVDLVAQLVGALHRKERSK